MSAQVDITTKLSYLLPTGTFLTFQTLAPLATNNGQCGRTEQILTAVILALLLFGCIVTTFTDSYTDENGNVQNGFLTSEGTCLWVPGYGVTPPPKREPGAYFEDNRTSTHEQTNLRGQKNEHKPQANEPPRTILRASPSSDFKPLTADYVNAALSGIAFLTLTMFTDPVSTCFYPHLSETLLKTIPVLLAAILSFCCSFCKIRHGYGNSVPCPNPAQGRGSSNNTANVYPTGTRDVATTHGAVDSVV